MVRSISHYQSHNRSNLSGESRYKGKVVKNLPYKLHAAVFLAGEDNLDDLDKVTEKEVKTKNKIVHTLMFTVLDYLIYLMICKL